MIYIITKDTEKSYNDVRSEVIKAITTKQEAIEEIDRLNNENDKWYISYTYEPVILQLPKPSENMNKFDGKLFIKILQQSGLNNKQIDSVLYAMENTCRDCRNNKPKCVCSIW